MYTNIGKQIKVIHFFNLQVQCSIKKTPNLWKNLNGSPINAVCIIGIQVHGGFKIISF